MSDLTLTKLKLITKNRNIKRYEYMNKLLSVLNISLKSNKRNQTVRIIINQIKINCKS